MHFTIIGFICFNSQPPEGGWSDCPIPRNFVRCVSTHSRPKAAGKKRMPGLCVFMSFNSQPPEGGWQTGQQPESRRGDVSTHSRPKAAGI